MWLNERRSHKAKTHHELHLLLLEFVDTLAEPVRDRIRRESEALCSPPAAPPPPPIPWPRGSLRSPLLAAKEAAENGTVRLNILMQACVVVFTKIMDTHDERGETCAPRAGKALAGCRCSAAVRAAAGSLFH